MMGKKEAPITPSNQTGLQDTQSSSQSSLKSLLQAGKAQTCTFTDKQEGSDVSGKSYITNGKMRTDIESRTSGGIITTHMILDGNTSYTWGDGQKTGFKFTVNPDEVENSVTKTPNSNQAVDINKVIDYKCSSWTVDNSLFVPPSDVAFSDFSSMMQPTVGSQGSFNPCAACENLSGEDKTSCRAALKCS